MDNVNVKQDLAKLDLPPADQLGFVVPDMAQALVLYEPLFGPFSIMDSDVEAANFRGQEADCSLKLAFGHSGELEIELIEIVSGSSPHSEFIQAGGNGMHHIRFRTADLTSKIAEAEALGFQSIWYKRLNEDIAWCYLERADDPLILEFLQMP